MIRLAAALTGDPTGADEVVQEAFLNLHVKWAKVDNPIGYLRTSVVNRCRSYHRHQQVLKRTAIPSATYSVDVADEISDALAKLPHKQRAALALKYFCDLPDADIAETLKVRPATVRSLIHRGLAQLRKDIS